MLAARSLRLAATRCYGHPALSVCSSNTRTVPKLQATTTTIWYTRPLAAAPYSKDVKSGETSQMSSNDISSSPPSGKPSSPSSSSNPKSSTSSASNSVEYDKTLTDKCSTGYLRGDTNVKLPSKDQVEIFFFKSMVYLWDFAYYVFCLCLKLIDTYVINNSTVQHYWKLLLKRMDDARKEIKSK